MELVVILGAVGFILRIGFTLSGLLFLWWRKEYRLDRMAIHLKTKQGENVLFGKTHIALLVAVLLWPLMPEAAIILLSLGMVVLGFTYLMRIRRWFFPPISPKVLVLGSMSLVGIALVVLIVPIPPIIALAIADLLLFPFSTLVVVGMSVPTRIYHWMVIRKAERKLMHHEPMIVIGITGSYGKTSVKEYLATVLSHQYSTLKTEASKNSPIGIAEVILRSLHDRHQAFVVEMGAYKRGEIAHMAHMVKPEIGILTAINPQHQDLFGSMETTMQAKYELMLGLTGRKIAIVNLDDTRTRLMGEWAAKDGCTVWGWTMQDDTNATKTIPNMRIFRAAHIVADMKGITFDCHVGNEKIRVRALVLGVHQVGNILAAIAGAVASGMKLADACAAVSQVTAAPGVMQVVHGFNGATFIDDTFNNNPDAARAAFIFLGQQHGKKIIVFQPMIELGSFAESAHEEVGKLAAATCDHIILTNNNFYAAFERGVQSVSSSTPLMVLNPAKTAAYIHSHIRTGDVVLFKGKDAAHALRILKTK